VVPPSRWPDWGHFAVLAHYPPVPQRASALAGGPLPPIFAKVGSNKDLAVDLPFRGRPGIQPSAAASSRWICQRSPVLFPAGTEPERRARPVAALSSAAFIIWGVSSPRHSRRHPERSLAVSPRGGIEGPLYWRPLLLLVLTKGPESRIVRGTTSVVP